MHKTGLRVTMATCAPGILMHVQPHSGGYTGFTNLHRIFIGCRRQISNGIDSGLLFPDGIQMFNNEK
jgi:hypothetical protein